MAGIRRSRALHTRGCALAISSPLNAGQGRISHGDPRMSGTSAITLQVVFFCEYYKLFYDRTHRDMSFQVGQWVWLRLLHRPITSLDTKGKGKLGPKFYGPFKIIDCVREVPYKLQLPTGAKLHDVFHVGLLNKFTEEPPEAPSSLPSICHGRACFEPATVIKSRLARGWHELLVNWKGQSTIDAT
jgi:hypothetical protein